VGAATLTDRLFAAVAVAQWTPAQVPSSGLRHSPRGADEGLVTHFARTPARAAGHHRRLLPLSLLAILAAVCATALLAAPAGAVVTEVEGTQVGLQPRTANLVTPSGTFSNTNGNPVVNGASVYLVYWDPGAWFHHEWVTKIDQFAQQLGAGSGESGTIFSALSQYRDRTNAQAKYNFVFKGAYSDTAPYPAAKCTDPAPLEFGQITCLTDAQLREQLESFIASRSTPKGMNAIYYVLTPPGVAVCLGEAAGHCSDFSLSEEEIEEGTRNSASYKNSFCSYHGAINPGKAATGDANTILYGAIPWTAGYEGHPWDFFPGKSSEGWAYDCQDGGWNPEGHGEVKEVVKTSLLEGPHIQEPNQEGGGEEGDYAPALSDVIAGQIAEEQANIVTDPLLTSWHNLSTGREATDECRNVFASTAAPSSIKGSAVADPKTEAGSLSNEAIGGGLYYVNNVINVGALHYSECVGGVGLVPRFTSPTPVNSNELVDFDGMESTVSEFKGSTFGASGPPTTTYATFSWNFGDGTGEVKGFAPGAPSCTAPWASPCAASAFHSYVYGGKYQVTLTVTDVAGNVAAVTHEVVVTGPPPPAPPASGAPVTGSTGASTTGASTTGGSSGGGSKGSGPGIVTPLAKAGVSSRSLRTALRRGLAVIYSVNEQVAGHFEVLMASTLASKLKISGPAATGLPAGTPPQVVIAKAVLVTTKGGQSTVHIKFSKKVTGRLKHVHSVPVLLRLVVRNASVSSPQTATVLSSVTLAG
jgi:hypothetical protein